MGIFKSARSSIGMTKWFIVTSWGYIVTKKFKSKVEFFMGIIPAWLNFTIATYKDCRKC
jgi:hypothetical protein